MSYELSVHVVVEMTNKDLKYSPSDQSTSIVRAVEKMMPFETPMV